MAPLTTRQRNSLPSSDFAIPEKRQYPIQDRNHADKALEFSKGTPDEARVRAAVAKRYPNMGSKAKPAAKQAPPQADVEPDADDQPGYSGPPEPPDNDADDMPAPRKGNK